MTGCARVLTRRLGEITPRFLGSMHVLTIPALSDNYMYLLVDEKTKQCAAVDPVEPPKILSEIKNRGLTLSCILTTHHHWDHAGGNSELLKSLSSPIPVYGGSSKIDAVTEQVAHGTKIPIGNDISVTCLHTPCHTRDHICYYATEGNHSECFVFTGDTLFLGGCGRFFEGNAQEMYHALVEVLGNLPSSTKVYCGHEYTLKNLKFAITVDCDNEALAERLKKCTKLRANDEPTVPGTIEEELATNPFMRVGDPHLQANVKADNAINAMDIIRRKKDSF